MICVFVVVDSDVIMYTSFVASVMMMIDVSRVTVLFDRCGE